MNLEQLLRKCKCSRVGVYTIDSTEPDTTKKNSFQVLTDGIVFVGCDGTVVEFSSGEVGGGGFFTSSTSTGNTEQDADGTVFDLINASEIDLTTLNDPLTSQVKLIPNQVNIGATDGTFYSTFLASASLGIDLSSNIQTVTSSSDGVDLSSITIQPTNIAIVSPSVTVNGSGISLGMDVRVTDLIVTNTVVETTVHISEEIANELKAGKMYKLTLLGKTSTANASQFFTLRFKLGGVTLITAPMAAKAVSNEHFRAEFYITIRTIGVGGTYAAHVEGSIGDEVIAAPPVTGTVDTTIAEDIVVTLQWDATNVGNVFTMMQSVLEVIG